MWINNICKQANCFATSTFILKLHVYFMQDALHGLLPSSSAWHEVQPQPQPAAAAGLLPSSSTWPEVQPQPQPAAAAGLLPSFFTAALPVSLPNPDCIPDGLLISSKYGLAEPLPPQLSLALRNFSIWETNAIQLDRVDGYTNKVQQPTTHGHQKNVKSFLGFVHSCYNRPMPMVNLSVYLEPIVFLAFISFLKVG